MNATLLPGQYQKIAISFTIVIHLIYFYYLHANKLYSLHYVYAISRYDCFSYQSCHLLYMYLIHEECQVTSYTVVLS